MIQPIHRLCLTSQALQGCKCVFFCFQTLVPAGYYIPTSHPVVSDKEIQDLARESKASTTAYIYQTPTAGKDVTDDIDCWCSFINKSLSAEEMTGFVSLLSPTGSIPSPAQEITPTSIRLLKPTFAAASPHNAQKAQRPSPAILNFTLQNLGLISGSSPGNGSATSQTPERLNTLASPLALQQRGMLFVKPVSPLPLQPSVTGQVALISVQQVQTGN